MGWRREEMRGNKRGGERGRGRREESTGGEIRIPLINDFIPN